MNEQQNADVRDQIGTKDGQYPPTKLMKIEVEAKLILTVPLAKDGEEAADFVLAAEQHINDCGWMIMRSEKDEPALSGTRVGIRIHVKDYKVTP